MELRFGQKQSEIKEPRHRAEEWKNLLVRCVSEFESLANDVRNQLLKIPLSPKRKKDLNSLSFQRILNANECVKNWFGIEVLGGFSEQDVAFINKMFNRRHLVIHKGGQVDEEYLTNTKDSSVRLNQVIRIDSQEIRRLITLTKSMAENLVEGYHSIQ